jgi:hypothetical protein
MSIDTFSIPIEEVDQNAEKIPELDIYKVLEGFSYNSDPTVLQNLDHATTLSDLEAYKEIQTKPQVEIMKKNNFNEKENFILSLREKHPYPSSFKASTRDRRNKHYNPDKKGVSREELHSKLSDVPDYNMFYVGDYRGDRIRQQVKESTKNLAHDGRTTSTGMFMDSFAQGRFVVARQSPYEAMHDRNTKQVKRELESLKDMRGIKAMPMRAVSLNWQGPEQVHRPSIESDKIPRRQVIDGRQNVNLKDGTGVYFKPYQPPKVLIKNVQKPVYPGRREVTGSTYTVQRPQIEQLIIHQERPRFSETRTPNPTDVSTYTGASAINNKESQLNTSYLPTHVQGAQRDNWMVAGNRAIRQFDISNPVADFSTEMQFGKQQQLIQRKHQSEPLYGDRLMNNVNVINKVLTLDRAQELNTHRDPLMAFARHMDEYTL